MTNQYKKLYSNKAFFYFALCTILTSCGVYKNLSNNDGIYENQKNEDKIIVLTEQEYSNYNKDYFAEELDLVNEIKKEDIFLDANEYNSKDTTSVNNKTSLNYTPKESWGREKKMMLLLI